MWFENYHQIGPYFWALAKIAASRGRWWFFGVIFGNVLRGIVGGIHLHLYAVFVREVPVPTLRVH